VTDGHLASIRVSLASKVSVQEIRAALSSFTADPQRLKLHSAPERPIIVRNENDRPQPRLDRDSGNGMSVTVGRIMPDNVLDYRLVALGHNTIRGAAGAAILNAELLVAMNKL
jgi:aspartate-semialdehyde dehydrogenase